jgi:hypothetical protein
MKWGLVPKLLREVTFMHLKNWRLAGLTLIALLYVSALAYAHHSSAQYDLTKPTTLNGAVKSVEWVNPHILVYVDVKGADGKVDTWVVQAAAPNLMVRLGLTKEALKPGAQLVVSGHPPKAGVTDLGLPSGADLIKAGRMVYSYDVKLVSSAPGSPPATSSAQR